LCTRRGWSAREPLRRIFEGPGGCTCRPAELTTFWQARRISCAWSMRSATSVSAKLAGRVSTGGLDHGNSVVLTFVLSIISCNECIVWCKSHRDDRFYVVTLFERIQFDTPSLWLNQWTPPSSHSPQPLQADNNASLYDFSCNAQSRSGQVTHHTAARVQQCNHGEPHSA
jgi:hypothetical protein